MKSGFFELIAIDAFMPKTRRESETRGLECRNALVVVDWDRGMVKLGSCN